MAVLNDAKAPLGPIKYHRRELRPGLNADYYTDQKGNEYNSIQHVALCAVAEALR